MPVKWDDAAFKKLCLAIIATNESTTYSAPKIAKFMGPDTTPKACEHQLARIKRLVQALLDDEYDDLVAGLTPGGSSTPGPKTPPTPKPKAPAKRKTPNSGASNGGAVAVDGESAKKKAKVGGD